MKKYISIIVFLSLHLCQCGVHSNSFTTPVIGILAVDTPSTSHCKTINATSELVANYVKFVEMAGARAAPIFLNQTEAYYQNILSSVNGVLFPGGSITLATSLYAKAARIIYDIAVQLNNNNTYFPIWGTCLGFEMLAQLISNQSEIVTSNCSCKNVSMPLKLEPEFHRSRLFREIPSHVVSSLISSNVTYNYHHLCLTPKTVNNTKLNSSINVLSLNEDTDGQKFVSIYEAMRYPFYGVQWHPEKNNFEWAPLLAVPHSPEAINVAQYFANFFIGEARKNNQHFDDWDKESSHIIASFHDDFHYWHDVTNSYSEVYCFINKTIEVEF